MHEKWLPVQEALLCAIPAKEQFDPASLEIIDRLNRILASQQDVLNAVQAKDNSATSLTPLHAQPTPSYISPQTDFLHESDTTGVSNGDSVVDSFGVPSSYTSPDNVLTWPIFHRRYEKNCLQNAVFKPSSQSLHHTQVNSKRVKFGFQEDKVPELMEQFFLLVHIKNPVVDEEELKSHARNAVEEGLSWDEGSCLVLLACALGTIAVPFQRAHEIATLNPAEYRELPALLDTSKLEEAESYFILARRRIGNLSHSIAGVQCLFLSGVFYMYTFRPLDAYQSFHQASVMYQVYAKSKQGAASIPSDLKTEQRLFWSCFKSECEILSEIDLPHSGVSHLDYVHIFPSPPHSDIITANPNSVLLPDSAEQARHGMANRDQEQGWFYYLSEIALRRIGNRILESLYKDGFESWTKLNIPSTIQIANEFLRQLTEWCECLPAPMRVDDKGQGILSSEELPWLLYVRLREIRSWILRPFVFLAIHLPLDDHRHLSLEPFVADALVGYTELIEANSVCHRHHGTWYMLRLAFTSAVCLLAAARQNLGTPRLRESVELTIECLRYWEIEAPGDIQKARVILEEEYLASWPG
ncbi:uncharacterized protein N7511_002086 [Penicillium nucicola]|uniref:uncharacterized protein n=1 Tax=Penicillium nucicola TaxID=1850975 RepID=UPI0025451189|nr:uncharacterized protein N7511_002086 [Penicillium nucicola]KAJ5770035.1 hypothetical protein N7511_002086 [Penicillium nucicola]